MAESFPDYAEVQIKFNTELNKMLDKYGEVWAYLILQFRELELKVWQDKLRHISRSYREWPYERCEWARASLSNYSREGEGMLKQWAEVDEEMRVKAPDLPWENWKMIEELTTNTREAVGGIPRLKDDIERWQADLEVDPEHSTDWKEEERWERDTFHILSDPDIGVFLPDLHDPDLEGVRKYCRSLQAHLATLTLNSLRSE